MADTTAKFTFAFEDEGSDALAKNAEAANSLSDAMAKSEAKIKDAGNALKRLQGKSAEVVAARTQLKAVLNSEKAVMSSNALAMAKLGTTYEKTSEKAKKLKEQQEKLKNDRIKEITNQNSAALSEMGGKLGVLKGLFTGSASGAELATVALGAFAAATLAVTVGLVAGAAALAKWAIGAANTARSLGLMREAASGSAANAAALGSQIEVLSRKVPTSKQALNEMSVQMLKAGIGGQTLVDTLNAVAQASAALGDDAGSQLKEFVERGRLTQRFQINPMELKGPIKFDDIAQALSKNLKVGINDARLALMEGRVKLGDGAKAMRTAMEAKFGSINLRKMLDLNVMADKFKETIDELTSGIDLTPLLEGLTDIASIFSTSTESGAALKDMLSAFGTGIGVSVKENAPLVKNFIRGLIIGALDIGIAYYKVRNALRDTFGDSKTLKSLDLLNTSFQIGKFLVTSFAVGFVAALAIGAAAIAPFVYVGMAAADVIGGIVTAGQGLVKWWKETDFTALGTGLINGLLKGITDGKNKVVSGVKGLASDVKNAFKAALGIQSPSKVFTEFGKHTTAGYAKGVEQGSPEANEAVSSMVDSPKSRASASAEGGSGGLTINLGGISVTIGGGGASKEAVQGAIDSDDFRNRLIKLFQETLIGVGVPVHG